MTSPPKAGREVLPRYIFFESLLPKSRVLEVGAVALTEGRSAKFLKERGAEQVVAIDADAAAVERARKEATDGVELRAGDWREMKETGFDLVFVHRAGLLVQETDRIKALKGLLARRGRLVVAVRHPDGIALGQAQPEAGEPEPKELEKLLRAEFDSVEVSTQTAFVGYSVTPTGVEEPTTALDESLTDAAPPAYSLFLCGTRPAKLDTVAMTPLPSEVVREVVSSQAPPAAEPVRPESPRGAATAGPISFLEEIDDDLQNQRIRELEQKTQSALEELERAELAAAQALAERDSLKAKLKSAQAAAEAAPKENPELEKLKTQLAELESQRKHDEKALQKAQKAAARAIERGDQIKKRLEALEAELDQAKKSLSQKTKEAAKESEARTKAEERAEALKEKVDAANAKAAEAAAEAEGEAKQRAKAEEEGQAAKEKAEQLQGELEQQAAARGRAEESLADMARRIESAEKTISKLEADLAAKKPDPEAEQRIAKLQADVDAALSEAARLERELAEAKQAAGEGAKAEVQRLEAQFAEATRSAAEAANAETEKLAKELAEAKRALAEQEAAKGADQKRVDELEAEIESQLGELEEIRSALKKGKAVVEREVAARAKAEKIAASADERVAEIEEELKARLAEVEEKLAAEAKAKAEAEQRAKEAEERLTSHEIDIEDVRRELEKISELSLEASADLIDVEITDTAQADATALAKELELTRSEADQLLAFLMERQEELAKEIAARAQAEQARTAAEARIRELAEKLSAFEGDRRKSTG